jgi:hypothetical protein
VRRGLLVHLLNILQRNTLVKQIRPRGRLHASRRLP